jgi:hypothetical protein
MQVNIQRQNMIYLELGQGTIDPFSALCHAIHIAPGFDALLDFTSIVEDTAITVHVILDRNRVIVIGRIAEDRVIPAGKVRVVLNELVDGIPLV